jgi:hypothetical protein
MQRRLSAAAISIVLAFSLAVPAEAQSFKPAKRSWKKAWIASAIALAAASAFDAGSSAGRFESNPLFRSANGTFSGHRAFAIKGGTTAGIVLMQALFGRKNPEMYRQGAILNGSLAGAYSALALRNLGVEKAGKP